MSDEHQADGADHKEKAQRLGGTLRKACFCLAASLVAVVLVVLVSCWNRKGDLAGLLLPPVSTTSTAAAVCCVPGAWYRGWSFSATIRVGYVS